jgi:hypothetical protein
LCHIPVNFALAILEKGSPELFAQVGLKPQSFQDKTNNQLIINWWAEIYFSKIIKSKVNIVNKAILE